MITKSSIFVVVVVVVFQRVVVFQSEGKNVVLILGIGSISGFSAVNVSF